MIIFCNLIGIFISLYLVFDTEFLHYIALIILDNYMKICHTKIMNNTTQKLRKF